MSDESARKDSQNRARQAKAWSIALDPVYGMIGLGAIGYGIDYLADSAYRWTIILAITGLVVGFYSAALQGVFTHPGESWHLHVVFENEGKAGHADDISVGQGAVLKLPVD